MRASDRSPFFDYWHLGFNGILGGCLARSQIIMHAASASEEGHAVYTRYQVAIHHDKASDCTMSRYTHFLCNSTLEVGRQEGARVSRCHCGEKIVRTGAVIGKWYEMRELGLAVRVFVESLGQWPMSGACAYRWRGWLRHPRRPLCPVNSSPASLCAQPERDDECGILYGPYHQDVCVAPALQAA